MLTLHEFSIIVLGITDGEVSVLSLRGQGKGKVTAQYSLGILLLSALEIDSLCEESILVL